MNTENFRKIFAVLVIATIVLVLYVWGTGFGIIS
jgi:regulatory protein YycH of two-component signal transduction system YycFG